MEEVIYTKYANERSRDFAVRTEILEDENGKRRVRKTALYPEGKDHVCGLCEKCERLSRLYEHTILECNKASLEKDGVSLEYIEGETLEEKLDLLLLHKQVHEAEKLLKSYLQMIRSLVNGELFEQTDEFCRVFGQVRFSEPMDSISCANIDMVCSNIMIKNDRWFVIDYEWTFFFPIPVRYLLFRILHYFFDTDPCRKVMDVQSLYQWAGISEEDCAVFTAMEQSFQTFLIGSHIPMREMYGTISPGTYRISHLVQKEEIRANQQRLQIYFLDDSGYREENSRCYYMKGGLFSGKIAIPDGTKEIRLDPGDGRGVCEVLNLSYNVGSIDRISLSDGMYQIEDFLFLMNREDPQIYLGKVPEGAGELYLELKVTITEPESVIVHELFETYISRKRETIEQLKNRLLAANQMLEKERNQVRAMEQTKVWKAYRKYRELRERK